jgi:hypothetical protein
MIMKKITRFFLVLAAFVASGTMANAINTECAGTDTQAAQGSFTLGYNYTFSTSGTSVTFTCECLDAKTGLVAYAWTYNPGFGEVQMTQGTGQIFSKTFTGQTIGASFNVACKFAYAGGMAVTKTFTYTVGNACSGGASDTEAPTAFTATKGTVTPTSVELLLNATDNSGSVSYAITYGTTTVNTTGTSATQKSYVVTGLTAETAYSFSVTAKDASNNAAANNPQVVSATTTAFPAAPTPILADAKVMSVYSGTYTNLPVTRQDWYGNTFSTVTLGGNEATKNVSICCFGFEFTAKPINVSSMTKLHVDIYPTTLASMSLGVTDGGDKMKTGIALTANQWNSVNVTLSELNANLANVNQIGFWNLNGTFYYDNLYFYNDATTGVSKVSLENAVRVYPNPATNSLTISAQSEISAIKITNLVGQTVKSLSVNAVERIIDLNDMSNGQYIISLSLKNGQIANQKFTKK